MRQEERSHGVTDEPLEIEQSAEKVGNLKRPKESKGIKRGGMPFQPEKSGTGHALPHRFELTNKGDSDTQQGAGSNI